MKSARPPCKHTLIQTGFSQVTVNIPIIYLWETCKCRRIWWQTVFIIVQQLASIWVNNMLNKKDMLYCFMHEYIGSSSVSVRMCAVFALSLFFSVLWCFGALFICCCFWCDADHIPHPGEFIRSDNGMREKKKCDFILLLCQKKTLEGNSCWNSFMRYATNKLQLIQFYLNRERKETCSIFLLFDGGPYIMDVVWIKLSP